MPPESAAFQMCKLLAFLGALALLVCNTTAGLASGLAGGLALATAAIFCTLTQVAGFDRLNVFHKFTFHLLFFSSLLYHKQKNLSITW